jgi:hypothetical protein
VHAALNPRNQQLQLSHLAPDPGSVLTSSCVKSCQYFDVSLVSEVSKQFTCVVAVVLTVVPAGREMVRMATTVSVHSKQHINRPQSGSPLPTA